MSHSVASIYRYEFQKGGRKHACPRCGQRCFVRYIDTRTGELMPSPYGRCDREIKCQYWMKPDSRPSTLFIPASPSPLLAPSFMQPQTMLASMRQGHVSTFAKWMTERFGNVLATSAMSRYRLGASKHWDGATVFWQVDINGSIRGGKVMLYDETGHRVKAPENCITWAHRILRLKNYNLSQCFYGEHLLSEQTSATVAIVESEKTAIIASIYLPDLLWIATGGKNGCRWKTNTAVTSVLENRNVILFPDLGAFSDWQRMADVISQNGARVVMNSLLEKNATDAERDNGLDLADYLLRFSPEDFLVPNDGNECVSINLSNQEWDNLNHNEPWEIDPF